MSLSRTEVRYDLSHLNRSGDYTVVNKLFFCCITSLWIIRKQLAAIAAAQENTINVHALIHLILPASLWCENYGILAFATSMVIAWCLLSNKTANKLFYPIELIALFFISLY